MPITYPKNTPILIYDGICNLCNASVNFIRKFDKNNQFYFISMQSSLGQQLMDKTKPFQNLKQGEESSVFIDETHNVNTKATHTHTHTQKLHVFTNKKHKTYL